MILETLFRHDKHTSRVKDHPDEGLPEMTRQDIVFSLSGELMLKPANAEGAVVTVTLARLNAATGFFKVPGEEAAFRKYFLGEAVNSGSLL